MMISIKVVVGRRFLVDDVVVEVFGFWEYV